MTLVTVTLVRVILPAFEIVPEIIIVPPGGTGFAGQFFVTTTRSEEHTSELQSHSDIVCRLLLEKKKDLLVDGAARNYIITLEGHQHEAKMATVDEKRDVVCLLLDTAYAHIPFVRLAASDFVQCA